MGRFVDYWWRRGCASDYNVVDDLIEVLHLSSPLEMPAFFRISKVNFATMKPLIRHTKNLDPAVRILRISQQKSENQVPDFGREGDFAGCEGCGF
jgi:hypothetical protein